MCLKKVLLFIRISIRPFLFYIFVKLKDLQFNLFLIFPYYLKVVKSFEKFSFHILVRLACSLSFQSFKTLFSYKVTYIRFVLISTSFDVYNNNNIYSNCCSNSSWVKIGRLFCSYGDLTYSDSSNIRLYLHYSFNLNRSNCLQWAFPVKDS